MEIREAAGALTPELIRWRRALHQVPEVGNALPKTQETVCAALEEMGIGYHRLSGCSGILAELQGQPGAHTAALRADMDALPVQECTGLPFASGNGCMHACGHDGHMAMLLGAAKLLRAHPEWYPGRIRLIFQPGEENVGGARLVIAEGALEGVGAIFGQHAGFLGSVAPGVVSLRPGTVMASFDCFDITVTGKSCHGARPEQGIDPIVCAAQLITSIQTLVSRECAATDPAVVTVGSIHGGSIYNIIPEAVSMKGALRTCNAATRDRLCRRLRELVEGVCAAMGAKGEIAFLPGYSPVVNDPACTALVAEEVRALLGENRLHIMDAPSMVSEDMSEYLSRIPGCFWLFDTPRTDPDGTPIHCTHHAGDFDLDEGRLWEGSALLASAAVAWLRKNP